MVDAVGLGESSVLRDVLDGDSIGHDPALLPALHVHLPIILREPPLVRPHDLLVAGELELGAAKSFDDFRSGGIFRANRDEDITNIDTGSQLHGLAVRTTHTRRKPIRTCARKHFVLTNDVVRVASGSDMVGVFSSILREVLITSDTSSLQGTGRDLLLLVRHKVSYERKQVDAWKQN